jgi:hypothetical protein
MLLFIYGLPVQYTFLVILLFVEISLLIIALLLKVIVGFSWRKFAACFYYSSVVMIVLMIVVFLSLF